MTERRKLGLFGGSFDPVHNAHIEIALRTKEQLGLEEVHFILAKEAPHKRTYLEAEKRFELLSKALQDQPGLIPSRIELDRAGVSYSYLTVEEYHQKYPGFEFFWIMGEDAFANLEEWCNYDYLAKNLEFIVIPRERHSAKRSFASDVDTKKEGTMQSMCSANGDDSDLRRKFIDISSTMIRERISKGQSLKGLIPESIQQLVAGYYSESRSFS